MSFKDMLLESKAGKNLHLEHLEDEIINHGVPGGRAAINFLRSLRDMLAGGFSFQCQYDGQVGRCAGNLLWY